MCVIAIVKPQVVLRQDDLKAMWEANSHGAGLAVYRDGQWHMEKGFMIFEALNQRLKELGLLDTEVHPTFVVHFRLVSVGEKTPALTHPFPVKLREGTGFLFHNGTLEIARRGYYSSSGMEVPQGESDTSQMAKLLSELRLSKKQLKLLLKEGGLLDPLRSGSRFAVCLPGEEEPLLVGEWHEYKGMLVSNKAFVSHGSLWKGWNYHPYYRSYWECDEGCGWTEKKSTTPKVKIARDESGLFYRLNLSRRTAQVITDEEAYKSLQVGEEPLDGLLLEEEEGFLLYTEEGAFNVVGPKEEPTYVYVPERGAYYHKAGQKPAKKVLALGRVQGKYIFYLSERGGWKRFGRLGQ